MHQSGGGSGSTGWGGTFARDVSQKALLRTHTTVTTIRHLAAHPRPPAKVFGIGRVFRNEAMDATHLPEFHQIEGILGEEPMSGWEVALRVWGERKNIWDKRMALQEGLAHLQLLAVQHRVEKLADSTGVRWRRDA